MVCKYVKEFDFGPEKTYVKGYARGGCASKKAAGGAVSASPKIGKVMGEFKAGELHSGSKTDPVVKSRKQAVAIAMSEARRASGKR